MKPETLKRIDRALWKPAALTGSFGSVLFTLRRSDPRTLLLRPGGMGDLICLTMAIEEAGLQKNDFVFFIERRSRDWARHLGLEHICYDENPILAHLKIAGRFRRVINTEQLFGLSQATARLARAWNGNLVAFETNRGAGAADEVVSYEPRASHETVEFSRILGNPLPNVPVRRRVRGASGLPLVGIGGLQSASRALTAEQWAGLIESWNEDKVFEIASAPADREFAGMLASRFPGRASVFSGDFSALCDRVAASPEIITVDSGFVHMATYYGVPTTALFTSGQERKWKPLAEGSWIIRRSDLACQPCTLFGQIPDCPHDYACKSVDFRKNLHKA